MTGWRVLFGAVLILGSISDARADTLPEAILSAGIIEQKFSFLRDDFRIMLRLSLGQTANITVNEDCPDVASICIYFVDARRAVETHSLRRHRRAFKLAANNMLAVSPNVILIDSSLAELMLFSLDIDGDAYVQWISDINEQVVRQRKPGDGRKRKRPDLKKKEQQLAASALSKRRAFSLFRKLQNIEYHLYLNVRIVGDEAAERLSRKRQQDPNIGPLAAVFLWQIAHETAHIKQYGGRSWINRLFFQNRRLDEDNADRFAAAAVKTYIEKLEELQSNENGSELIWGINSSFVRPAEFARLAVASSLSTWRLIGLRQIMHKIRGIAFRDLLFHLERTSCAEYEHHVKSAGLSIPPPPKQAAMNTTSPEDLMEARVRPSFLVTTEEIGKMRQRYSGLFNGSLHSFNYDRVDTLLSELSSTYGPAAFVATKGDLESGFFGQLLMPDDLTFKDDAPISTYVKHEDFRKLLSQSENLSVKIKDVINCPGKACEIVELFEHGSFLGVFEVVFEPGADITALFYHQRFFSEISERDLEFKSSKEYDLLERVVDLLIPPKSDIIVNESVGQLIARTGENYRMGHERYEAESIIEEVVAQKRLCEWGNVAVTIVPSDGIGRTLFLSSSVDSGFVGLEFYTR